MYVQAAAKNSTKSKNYDKARSVYYEILYGPKSHAGKSAFKLEELLKTQPKNQTQDKTEKKYVYNDILYFK